MLFHKPCINYVSRWLLSLNKAMPGIWFSIMSKKEEKTKVLSFPSKRCFHFYVNVFSFLTFSPTPPTEPIEPGGPWGPYNKKTTQNHTSYPTYISHCCSLKQEWSKQYASVFLTSAPLGPWGPLGPGGPGGPCNREKMQYVNSGAYNHKNTDKARIFLVLPFNGPTA